jgi:hypothetical protein
VYIEFQLLPTANTYTPDMTAQRILLTIKQEIAKWTTQYGITGYSQKTIKYTHRLGFNDEQHFSLFSMTWTPNIPFQIVRIENERY